MTINLHRAVPPTNHNALPARLHVSHAMVLKTFLKTRHARYGNVDFLPCGSHKKPFALPLQHQPACSIGLEAPAPPAAGGAASCNSVTFTDGDPARPSWEVRSLSRVTGAARATSVTRARRTREHLWCVPENHNQMNKRGPERV